MEEKRHFPRIDARIPVRLKVVDMSAKTEITNQIDAYTENLSQRGVRLLFPQGWECPECNNCLGWAYNKKCLLKENSSGVSDRTITKNLILKIEIPLASAAIHLAGECVWSHCEEMSYRDNYSLGVSFFPSEEDDSRYESYLSSLEQ